MNFIVYKVTNLVNGKIYIGYTTKTIKIRWKQHCNQAFNKNSNNYNELFKKAIRKYGKENFKIEEIEKCSSLDELKQREKFWIKELNTFAFNGGYGYNSTLGGDGGSGSGSISVVKLDIISGKILNRYVSIGEAITDNVRGVEMCCNYPDKNLTCDGYCFFKEEDIKDLTDEQIVEKVHNRYPCLVYQLDLDGHVIKLFRNAEEAAIATGSSTGNITMCCLGQRRFCSGYQWAYQRDIKQRIEKPVRDINVFSIPVIQYSLQGEKIKEWNSAREASRTLNLQDSKISSCCHLKRKQTGGYQWRFKEDEIDSLPSIAKPKVKDMQTGIVYKTINHCAKAVGASHATIKKSCENNKTCKYGLFNYVYD